METPKYSEFLSRTASSVELRAEICEGNALAHPSDDRGLVNVAAVSRQGRLISIRIPVLWANFLVPRIASAYPEVS